MLTPEPGQDPELAARLREKVLAAISPREMEFLLLASGADEYSYKQIAARMGIGEETVDGYRKSLFRKFGIRSKPGLVVFAYLWGIQPSSGH
ncbi:MAG: helix-turn-helix transcriptional regulator [Flavobacteriales bacterium]